MPRFAAKVPLLMLALAACTTDGALPSASDRTDITRLAVDGAKEALRDRPVVVGKSAELTYFNSKSFDVDLSDTMRSKVEEIRVAVPTPFAVDRIPESIDQWLYAVKKGGGRVVAEALPPPEGPSRGFALLILELAIPLVKAAFEPDRHAGADNYDAKLLYDKPSGTVQTILFTLKRPAA